jgi:hypothetical protein
MKKIGTIAIIAAVGILGLALFSKLPAGTLRADDDQRADAPAQTAETEGVVSTTQAIRYVNSRYGFSFEKPQGYTVGSVPEEAGETILVQKNGSVQDSFQIFITELDHPVELTPTLIKSELPGTVVSNPVKIDLDGKGKGIMFSSNNDAFGGKSFEIWFARDTRIYQITSYVGFAQQLQAIIGTWKFE